MLDMGLSESAKSGGVDPLLDDILQVVLAAGISRTAFGYKAAGDPTLIPKMERGRRIKKPLLRRRIEREIASIERHLAAVEALG